MRRSIMLKTLLAIAVTVLLAAPLTLAQRMGQGKGMPKYDPANEVTVQGTVEEVKEQTHLIGQRKQTGTHLVVKTDKETIEAHLGPSSFLAEKNFAFAKGDQIEVTGSKAKIASADVLLAREIKKGGQTLTLRDAKGVPAWSMGRRSRR